MFKNQTPQQISVIISAIAVASAGLLALLLMAAGRLTVYWADLLMLLGLFFAGAYAANFFLIRYYIFRRIKLIYKIIHRHKLPTDFRAERLDMGQNILEDVEKEVGEWADEHDRELEALERLATYRRRFIGDVSHELKTPIFNIQG
ncbi:MAG: HAMP domain-containing histidine kinase, partial [Saprospiraceae bacterium]|nr:HAMP domain-containing histidine kinase [Saprospiraceae bacterium]